MCVCVLGVKDRDLVFVCALRVTRHSKLNLGPVKRTPLTTHVPLRFVETLMSLSWPTMTTDEYLAGGVLVNVQLTPCYLRAFVAFKCTSLPSDERIVIQSNTTKFQPLRTRGLYRLKMTTY